MRVILQGSMQHFAAAELLTLLGRPGHSGTFDAASGEKRVRLFFREGTIAWAEGNAGANAQALVTDLVSWPDGTFTFLDALVLPDGITPLALDVAALLAEAEVRIAEAREVLRIYPDAQTVFRVVQRPAGDISMRAEEFQILFQIGTGRSLAQLRTDTKLSALELYPIVRSLQSAGLIEVVPAFDPDATAQERTPPPKRSVSRKKTTGERPPERLPERPIERPPESSVARPTERPVERSPEKPPERPVERTDKPAERPAETTPQAPIGTLTAIDGTLHPLLEDESVIGRTDRSAVALSDASVSSKHARVLRSGGAFAIEDLGSRNGTFVNGEKITEKRPLADGDVVRCGKVLLTFNIAAETRAKETTQPEVEIPRPPKP